MPGRVFEGLTAAQRRHRKPEQHREQEHDRQDHQQGEQRAEQREREDAAEAEAVGHGESLADWRERLGVSLLDGGLSLLHMQAL